MTLEARDLDFAFTAGRPVLRSLSARFAPGRLTAVLGPNGSGKSTLLRLLLGLLSPARGSATLAGTPTTALRGRHRAARLAYLPQRTESWLPFSVRDAVALGRFALPSDSAAVTDALRDAEVLDLASEPLGTLSVGQQQRVALARVLAQVRGRLPAGAATAQGASRALLADEPVSAMDPAHARRAMALLRDLARSGLAVVVVLHDFTLAAREADDALLLDSAGRAAAAGPVASVLTPDTLAPVFGIPFQRLDSPAHAGPVIVAGFQGGFSTHATT
ncbi:MAG: ABC transporter ATP-binding protein [Phycisphaerae bacterium]|nr:ABC transporter ATP-binding protein [Phycisphaerae bacterium]